MFPEEDKRVSSPLDMSSRLLHITLAIIHEIRAGITFRAWLFLGFGGGTPDPSSASSSK